jgi:hypothetical protein
MLCTKCKCCQFSWLSGFFALAAIVHIIRLVTQTPVQIGDFAVPMNASIAIAVIGGVLSLVFCKMGCKSCAC